MLGLEEFYFYTEKMNKKDKENKTKQNKTKENYLQQTTI